MHPSDDSRRKRIVISELSDQSSADYRLAKEFLWHFNRCVFPIIEPGKRYIHNWHLQYLSEYLELCSQGEIRKLIINKPPRHMKSSLITIAWPTWVWTYWPESRWLFSSYSGELAVDHSLRRRRIIRSKWYTKKWGEIVQSAGDQDRKTVLENTKRGFFQCTSTRGTTGGVGGDFIIIDDPLNPEKAHSKADREQANEHVKYLVTRQDVPKESRIVLIMQRLHHEDPTAELSRLNDELLRTGIIEEKDSYHLISIPAEFKTKRVFIHPKTRKKEEMEPGDILWPDRFGRTEINFFKEQLGSFNFESQYNQNPSPPGGGIVKRDWWGYFEEHPVFNRCGWYWDTAVKEKQMSDYSVGILAARGDKGVYILDMIHKKLIYPKLKIELRAAYNGSVAQFVMVEDKTSGQQLIQEFNVNDSFPVFPFKPQGDKVYRASLISPFIEAGKVFLPLHAPWLRTFLEEFDSFPKGVHDDIVDATVMAITDLMLNKKVGTYGNLFAEEPKRNKLSISVDSTEVHSRSLTGDLDYSKDQW